MKMSGTLEIQKKKQQAQHDIFFNKKIVAPQKLKILVLSGNQITSQQLEFIHKCTNLLKLDLSNNNITKISPKLNLDKLNKLEILYLHENKIQNTPALEGVFSLPKLTHLTIRDNPVKKLPRIQHIVVNLLPTLKVLDDRVIFIEQRSATLIWDRESVYIEPEICEGWKTKDNTEAHYIKILELQLKYFINVWVKNNPIIMIQRAWRQIVRYKRSKRIKERNNKDKRINNSSAPSIMRQSSSQILIGLNKYFGEWRTFAKNRKSVKEQLQSTSTYPENKIYLTYPLKKFKLAQRNLRVEKIIKNYVSYIRNKIFLRKMAYKIYRQLKIKRTQFNSQQSFFSLCHISQTHRFYFNKIQTHLLQNFLIHLASNFHYQNQIKQCTSTGPVTHYLSIRTVDPETYTVKKVYSVLTYSMWPSMRVVFLKKKKFQSKHKTGMIKIKPLYYIKNRNKVIPPQDFKKSCRIYKQLQNFHRKEYENTLDYFECRNEEIMKMLLRYIYYHNAKVLKFEKKTNKNQMQSLLENYDEPFMIYVENILQRTAAAVRIQQNWRKYMTNKRSEESIYVKMKKTRAALRIQRFWRDRIFYHRLSYQRNIAYHIKLFNLNSFMIPCQIYMRFEEICRKNQNKQLYKGLRIVKCGQDLRAIWNMEKPIYSPNIANNHFQKQAQLAKNSTEQSESCDVWNILHFKSKARKIQYGQKMFYEFKFDSVDEAKYRLYLISVFSYQCRHSTFFLPVSRDTLDLMHLRFQQYLKVGIIPPELIITAGKRNKSKNSLKLKEDQSARIDKIGILKYYIQEGLFLSDKIQALPKKSVYNFNSQFYQKIYQDHPKKETTQIYYYVDDSIKAQKQLQKQRAIQELTKDIDIEPESHSIKYSQINSELSEKPEQTFMNITKIDRKRLSFYDVGVRTEVLKKQPKQKPKTRGEFFYDNVDRRQNISRVKMQSTIKKQQVVQKKTENLKKMRENIQKQRQSNLNVKNRNEIERSQEMKRKVQRIRQMKSRVSNSRKQEHQQDFIQQGNFVMQQQLKMVIMRSKMESMQPRRRQKLTNKSETSSHKNSQSFSKSFYTEQKNKEIKVFQNGNVAKQIAQSLGATLVTNNPIEASNLIEGQQRKIINIRNQRRSKSRSIGAYLRDPSLVHGVFPEQYYPIDNKQGGTFKFLPPLI